jgi:hypothetical protein
LNAAPTRPPRDRVFLLGGVALLAVVAIAQATWGERIPLGDGLGWDGRFYSQIARDLPRALFVDRLDEYRLQRVVPPAVIWAVLRLTGMDGDDRTIVRLFTAYNFLLLVGVLFLWEATARRCGISRPGRWLGFLLLFVSFAHLKLVYYYPVLTDTTAFFLGALLLHLYVSSNAVGMWIVLAVGAFTWPSFAALGGLLFLFRPRPGDGEESGGALRPPLHLAAAAAAGLAFLAIFVGSGREFDMRLNRVTAVDERLLPVSLAAALLYLMGGTAGALHDPALFRWRSYRESLSIGRAAAWVILLAGAAFTIRTFAQGAPPLTPGLFLNRTVLQAVTRPGLSLVAHSVYLGVLPLLLVVYWRRCCAAAHRLGLGMTLFLAAFLTLSLNTESRILLHGVPAFVLLAVLATDDVRWPVWGRWLIAAVAVFASKVWFGINHGGFHGKEVPSSYPMQYYFMNLGPWIADEMYWLQGSLVVAAGLVIALVARRARPLAPEEREAPIRVSGGTRRVLRLAAAAVVVIALLEAGARLWLDAQRPQSPAGLRTDETLGWVAAAGACAPERVSAKAEGTRRIVLLGGALACGANAPEADTLRAVVEREVRRPACPPVEVLSAGAAGYSTDEAARLWRVHGRRYAADAVVLLFGAEDLAANVGAEEPPARLPRVSFDELPLPYTRWRGSAALRLVSNATLAGTPSLHRLLTRVGLAERPEPPPELWGFGPRPEVDDMWRRTTELLGGLRDETRAQGAALAVAYVPLHAELRDERWAEVVQRYRMSARFWRREKVMKRLASVCEALGVPLVDVRTALADPSAYVAGRRLWSAEGNRSAGRALARRITEGGPCSR